MVLGLKVGVAPDDVTANLACALEGACSHHEGEVSC
jgi:hypothetical protein